MYLTVHASVGAALSKIAPDPLWAFIIAAISHFALDAIPHGDEWIKNIKFGKTNLAKTAIISSIDFAIAMSMSVIWIKLTPVPRAAFLFCGISGAVAPDALWGLYEITQSPTLKWYRKFHTFVHKIIIKKQITPLQGFILQFAILAIATLIIAAK